MPLIDIADRMYRAVALVEAAHRLFETSDPDTNNCARHTLEEGVAQLKALEEEVDLLSRKAETAVAS